MHMATSFWNRNRWSLVNHWLSAKFLQSMVQMTSETLISSKQLP